MKNIFVTATDTDAGKTFVTCALSKAITDHNKRVAVFKPISAGCDLVDGKLINEDAKCLSEFANTGQSIEQINPIAYKEPIAPHIAASTLNQKIELWQLAQHFEKVLSLHADVTFVEGAGGWRLPLGESDGQQTFLSDFAKQQQCAVILVVNMKLGCLNHALLTYQAILADGLTCIGWIANNAQSDTMDYLAENISQLKQLIPAPHMATLAYWESGTFNDKVANAAQQINLDAILNV